MKVKDLIMRNKLEEIIPKEWLGKNRKAELIEILLPLFSVSDSTLNANVIKRYSYCCNALIDNDEQSLEICTNCGDRI